MKIHQIRNATIVVIYNDKRFLIDPWLMPKDFMPGFEGAMNSEVRQPRVDLPKDFDINHLPLDAVILTHFHPDHFDEFAVNALDKNIPFFVQNETDLNIIKNFGFNDVRIVSENGTEKSPFEIFSDFYKKMNGGINLNSEQQDYMKKLIEGLTEEQI